MARFKLALAATTAFTLMAASSAQAEEGMWTFDNFPAAKVNETYGTKIDAKWLNHIQSAAVRLSNCSASVVSSEGLVLTNAHCVIACAQDLSSPEADYTQKGFFTAARTEEKTCPGQSAEILTGITDITKDINVATSGLTGEAFVKALNAKASELEKAGCGTDQTIRCQVISFYQGGEYKLYKYRRYADVRLVFYPEYKSGFFGGDPDNFNFPRYNLDAAFLRVYENGKVVKTPNYLKFNPNAPKENDVTFVAGNPGSTQRLMTVAQLETNRNLMIPVSQLQRSELRGRIIQFMAQSPENKRIGTDVLTSLENGFKVFYGQQLALNNPAVMEAKRAEEAVLKAGMTAEDKAAFGDPWADIAAAQKDVGDLYFPYFFLESAPTNSSLFTTARTIVRLAKEKPKPSTERLPEFADTRLPALEKRLVNPSPVEKPLDQIQLEFRLLKAREYLTANSPVTKLLLGKESPEALAKRLIDGTKLTDIAYRKQLMDGGLAAVQASDDPMIQWALKIDDEALAVRKQYEARVTGPTRIASEKIAKIRFKAYGTSTYPDATFSLRLSYGKVTGWDYRGVKITPFTDIAGLFERATGVEPYELATSWKAAEPNVDKSKVFNYVTTNDIIGGNSGSPVINAKGEVIGAAFDGNIHSLGGAYYYDGTLNRTVVVSSSAIAEALKTVYDRKALLAELTGK
ncbi:S46 family peptidase [Asticcacaulis sp. ZE23SCel15]|uniref:S46 family peptidase n=1 Tax=Asticcacaulis sp. ZE23SCel15 TaxID=3059027 RepID=UPI00265E7CA5|nr:S46 family peptidase [Asticcacaulis sp. ZE23SCel15]WKL56385.1 S46 family peptidase [Asticcacaulis sp. ZE23SCel15]